MPSTALQAAKPPQSNTAPRRRSVPLGRPPRSERNAGMWFPIQVSTGELARKRETSRDQRRSSKGCRRGVTTGLETVRAWSPRGLLPDVARHPVRAVRVVPSCREMMPLSR